MDNKVLRRAVLLSWLFVAGGIFGFIYEVFFYRIDLGMWVKRGSTFGPWVPIYGFGALLILLATYKVRKHPALVVLLGGGICGILELATGFVLHKALGIRLWDYNCEIWNFGNVGGYICLRSVLVFGISSLLLQYAVLPILKSGVKKLPNTSLCILAFVPSLLFLVDMILYNLIK